MRALILSFLVALVPLLPVPATASEPVPPAVQFPLYQKDTDLGVHTLIVEAPDRAWGLRKIAADFDRRLAGVDIWARRGISCLPTVDCLKVRVENFGEYFDCGDGRVLRYAGCVWIPGTGVPWVLHLNTYYPKRKSVTCHEFAHALGLGHHEMEGCVGLGATSPSDLEIAVLEEWFSHHDAL